MQTLESKNLVILRDAIFKFSDMIQGKVVADIGAGTGQLAVEPGLH